MVFLILFYYQTMNCINKKLFLLLLLFCLNTLFAQSQKSGLPAIKNYNRIEYKGGTQNWDIDQDKYGNLYFANNKGLLQFDGTSWRRHTVKGIESIRCLKIDANDDIYVGGYKEFGFFRNNAKGELIYTSLIPLLDSSEKESFDFIWKVHKFKGGIVFQTFSNAFYYKDGKLKVIEAPSSFQFSFVVDGKLFFQDMKEGILIYRNNRLQKIPNTEFFNTSEIWSILPFQNDKLLIVTLNEGIFIYDNALIKPWKSEANEFVKRNSSLGGFSINNQTIVLNTVMDGIIICDIKGNIVKHLNTNKGLTNNTVLTSFVDSNFNIWLGLDNGIAFVNNNSPLTYYDINFNVSTVYASVAFGQKIYVATNRGLFYNDLNLTANSGPFKFVKGTLGQCWNIQVLDNQLVCANNSGALLIDENNHVTKLNANGYFGFVKHPDKGNFMIGATYQGYALFEKRAGKWCFLSQITGSKLSSLHFELDAENIWIIKDSKLYQLQLSDDLKQISKVTSFQNISNTIPGIGAIQHLNGKLYFETNNHFFNYNKEEGIFVEDLTMSQNFKNVPKIRQIFQDKLNNIWFTNSQGLGVFWHKKSHKGNNILLQTGITIENLNEYFSINTFDDENIFIGVARGLAHYNPKIKSNIRTKPNVFIRNFIANEDTLLFGNRTQKIPNFKISYSNNKIKFTFSTPTYDNIENIQFAVKLEGLDNKWSDWSDFSTKEYTNLFEGNYIFKIKVRNSHSVVSSESKVGFSILPPWYRSTLAYFGYLVLLIGLTLFIRQRIKIKMKKAKYYESIEQRRIYLEKENKIRQEQYELEQEIIKLNNEKIKSEMSVKDQDLVNKSFQVNRVNKTLNGIIGKLKKINETTIDKELNLKISKLQKNIEKEVSCYNKNKDLEKHIQNLHYDFVKRLKEKFPKITPGELDLATYLVMNLSTKEIAEIRNISLDGVEIARYRLRKKLNLDAKENLTGFLLKI